MCVRLFMVSDRQLCACPSRLSAAAPHAVQQPISTPRNQSLGFSFTPWCTKAGRSEERRVGKECRSRWRRYAYQKLVTYTVYTASPATEYSTTTLTHDL